MTLNCCRFCQIPFTTQSIASEYNVDGRQIVNIKCTNCGAELKFSLTIEQGPTKKNWAINERKDNELKPISRS